MIALGYPVKSDAQIRQWRTRHEGRVPSPENCVGLELATCGAIRRQDLRQDWMRVWPELAGDKQTRLQNSLEAES
ncbi:hypothetical protein CAL20_02795 [Bordetella genomosp. 4]|uniref:Uncharacterized protein n=1 Tax=Bordetella genomosp. 4 TaxID=463044 RepID=A0A261USQ3_9BORD|nr:hypothetical protein CAL20_02795 [Bordetella genomosp. 4]